MFVFFISHGGMPIFWGCKADGKGIFLSANKIGGFSAAGRFKLFAAKTGGGKLNIGFMGAGRVGGALGLYFKKHGLCVAGYYSRQFTSAKQAALLTETAAFPTFEALAGACSMIFFTTPDHVLEEMDKRAASYVRQTEDPGAKTWVHVSGVFPSSHLHSLQALGCPVGSMHPLQSFGAPECSAPLLENTSFSLEGNIVAGAKAALSRGGQYHFQLYGHSN